MQKQTYQIEINAPAKAVWEAIIDPKKYRIWTYPFNKDSHFDGGWNKGDTIHFIGCDEETEELSGMISQIEESTLHKFISIKHLGILKKGVSDFDSEEVKKWAPSYENYTFTPTANGGTLFTAEVDLDESYTEMFEPMWTAALKVLKLISEEFFQIQTVIQAPIDQVWEKYNSAEHITQWNAASPDWECPKAENNLVAGGKFSFTMAAKDGSVSFDFSGVYFDIAPNKRLAYKLDDDRLAYFFFEQKDDMVEVTGLIQAEKENPTEMQQQGWQAILDNFKTYCQK